MSARAWLERLWRAVDARAPAELEADVRAELEHHLACAERELVAAGETPERARALARERFGDLEAARAACLGIHMGGRIVLQRIHLAVTGLLLVAVLVLAWASHSSRAAALRAAEEAMALRAEAHERAAAARQPVAHVVVEIGDQLQMIDEFNPDVHGTVTVAEDGKVPLPQAGWVFVHGKTREEVEQILSEALAPYFLESKVRVIVKKADAFQALQFEAF
ncbi:MAG TPA: polysaccharide biosynthesis/export family protein [Planctomycetota bacterium]